MKYLSYTLSIIFFAFLVSCSSGGKKQTEEQPTKDLSSTGITDVTQEVDSNNETTVHLYGIDKMQFVVAEKSDNVETSGSVDVNGKTYYVVEGINAKAGEELSVKLTTISKLAAATMSHNWLLLKQEANPKAFVMASIQAKENDYVAPEKMDMVIIETGLVAPGKTKTITFTAPEETGDYEYICTFPGHFTAGMRGTLHVK